MKRDVQVVRDSIGRIVSMLTARKLQVTQRGTMAYVAYHPTTGDILGVNLPYIPDDASEEFISAIQGFLDHEVGHVLHTDQAVVVKAGKAGKRVSNMANVIEDVYIERKMTETFTGSGSNLDVLRKFYFENVVGSKMRDAIAAGNTEHAQGYATVLAFRAWGGQPFAADMIKQPEVAALVAPIEAKLGKALIGSIRKCNSSQDCLDLAKKVVKALERTKPPAPPPPPAPAPTPAPAPAPEEEDDGRERDAEDQDDEQLDPAAAAALPPEAMDASDEDTDPADADATTSEAAPEGKPESEDDAERADEEESTTPAAPPAAGAGDDDGDASDEDAGDDEGSAAGGPEGAPTVDDEDGDDEPPASSEGSASPPSPAPETESEDEPEPKVETEGELHDDDDGRGEAPPSEPGEAGADEGEGAAPETADEGAVDEHAPGDPSTTEGDVPPPSEGGGPTAPPPKAEVEEEDLGAIADERHDFDEEVSDALTERAAREMGDSTYRVFSTEFDIIRPAPKNGSAHQIELMVDECTAAVGVMQKHLERAMAAQNRKAWNPGLRRGRIAPGALFRTGVGDDRVFRQRTETRAKNTACSLVIDCSGSMHGHGNIGIAGTAAYALSSTLERLKIKNEVIGFTTWDDTWEQLNSALSKETDKGIHVKYSRTEPLYMPIFKSFNDRLDADAKSRLAALRDTPHWLNQNIDGECIAIAAHRLRLQKAERHVMIVLSDGSPAASTAGTRELNAHLKATVQALEAGGVEVIGIGLNTRVVEHFYRKSLVLSDTSELATTLIGELTKLLLAD